MEACFCPQFRPFPPQNSDFISKWCLFPLDPIIHLTILILNLTIQMFFLRILLLYLSIHFPPLKISDSKSHNSNFPYNSDFISCNSVFCPQNRFYFTSLILNLTIQTFPLRIPILYLRIPIFPQNSDFIFHNSDSISCNSDVLIFRF